MKFKDTSYGDLTGQVFYGNIYVQDMGLTSLEGAPIEVVGTMDISGNDLTTLEHAPKKILQSFSASGNKKLKSLQYAPIKVETIYLKKLPLITDINKQIVDNNIRAGRYILDSVNLRAFDFKDDFKKKELEDAIKSKGFRTLLGLKNEI